MGRERKKRKERTIVSTKRIFLKISEPEKERKEERGEGRRRRRKVVVAKTFSSRSGFAG